MNVFYVLDNNMSRSNSDKIYNTMFFTMDKAINSDVSTGTAFIISNEKLKANGDIGRYFTVFATFEDFLKRRSKYKHCHEILIDHTQNEPNAAGRLVFDFDIKDVVVPKDFCKRIEQTVIKVVDKYFVSVDPEKFVFVWSTSANPTKFSKHLTVQNLYFDQWLQMSKLFYRLFCLCWQKKFDWIGVDKLIDSQIIRTNASLRMVGSSKINGYDLKLDDADSFSLTDSLIRIYNLADRQTEQLVTIKNFRKKKCLTDLLGGADISGADIGSDSDTEFGFVDQFNFLNRVKNITTEFKTIEPIFEPKVYDRSLEICDKIQPGFFQKGKINGGKMTIMRKKPGKCLLSGNIHEKENAFLEIIKKEKHLEVRFGCYRYCHSDDSVVIGGLRLDTFKPISSIVFTPPKPRGKKYRNKKEILRDKRSDIKKTMKVFEILNMYTESDIAVRRKKKVLTFSGSSDSESEAKSIDSASNSDKSSDSNKSSHSDKSNDSDKSSDSDKSNTSASFDTDVTTEDPD